jgi:hypothetical protein
MSTLHYQTGYLAAKSGAFRAAPNNLKIVTPAWRDWYEGYDAATMEGVNKQLNKTFSLRTKSGAHNND